MSTETASDDAANSARDKRLAGIRKHNFKPGQSGNPNGRPKKTQTVLDLAKENSEKALRRLATLIDSEDERVAIQAAMAILDRAVGKPKQSVETTQKREAADYTESELIALARLGSTRTAAPDESEEQPHRIQ